MAESKPAKRPLKKTETVRERSTRTSNSKPKVRRLRKTADSIGRPAGAVKRFGGREYYLPMPDNRIGQFLNKRRSFMPKFFKEAWAEVRQVDWPDRRATVKLTLAVFVFSFIFGLLVTVVDYGLGKLFRKVFVE